MIYKISDKCIQCFGCLMNRICSEGAIVQNSKVFSIDPDKCTDCGTCFNKQEYFCPVRAVVRVL